MRISQNCVNNIFFKWAIPGLFFLHFRLFNTDLIQFTVNEM